MKISTLLSTAAVAAAGLCVPQFALAASDVSSTLTVQVAETTVVMFDDNKTFEIAKRGRGRGKVRVPGGSGCDDPGDIIEHPECRG
jgi:hypothetical protein